MTVDELQPDPHEGLEAQIAQWRRYVQRREAISAADVDEMEDHLRERIDELSAAGLDDEESFLVAVKRMGSLDEVSQALRENNPETLTCGCLSKSASSSSPAYPVTPTIAAFTIGASSFF